MKLNLASGILLPAIAVAVLSTPSAAFTPGACRADAKRLCPDRAEKDMVGCLKEFETQLSTACRVNLAVARERVRQAKEACEDEQKKWCADVKPGQGRIVACLKTHESELSSDCKEKIAAVANRLHAGAQADLPAVSTSTPVAAPAPAK